MFNLLAHAGHEMEMDGMSAIDHCMPIIVGAGISIAILVGIIVYMLIAWEPKKATKASSKKTSNS
jgi:hypothetical protein